MDTITANFVALWPAILLSILILIAALTWIELEERK